MHNVNEFVVSLRLLLRQLLRLFSFSFVFFDY